MLCHRAFRPWLFALILPLWLLATVDHSAAGVSVHQRVRDLVPPVTKTLCPWTLPPCAADGTCEVYGFVEGTPGNAVRVGVRVGHKRRTGPLHEGIWQVWGFVRHSTGESYSTPVWFEWPGQPDRSPCLSVRMTFTEGQVLVSLRDLDEALGEGIQSVEVFQATLPVDGVPVHPAPRMRLGVFSQRPETLTVEGAYADPSARIRGTPVERGLHECASWVENIDAPTRMLTFQDACPTWTQPVPEG